MEKTRDEVITTVSRAYDQLALIHQSKIVLDESKRRLDANRKTADKALGYGLITPYDHKKIELAQATLDAKVVEYEGKKRTSADSAGGIDRSRKRKITSDKPCIGSGGKSSVAKKASKKELKFVHSIMELMLQIIKYKQKEHGGFQKFS